MILLATTKTPGDSRGLGLWFNVANPSDGVSLDDCGFPSPDSPTASRWNFCWVFEYQVVVVKPGDPTEDEFLTLSIYLDLLPNERIC